MRFPFSSLKIDKQEDREHWRILFLPERIAARRRRLPSERDLQ